MCCPGLPWLRYPRLVGRASLPVLGRACLPQEKHFACAALSEGQKILLTLPPLWLQWWALCSRQACSLCRQLRCTSWF